MAPPARRLHAARLALASVCALACAGGASTGCTTLATSPSWTGGGLVQTASTRQAAEEAREEAERAARARQPAEIGAKHILVMHAASQSKPEAVTRTRDEAKARAQQCLLRIRGGETFEAVVKECTDEPGGAERGGDLGVFERGQMVKTFGDAAFALRVNEVSEVVETPFGFHIIKRTE
jgi:parvulin-like peptidyl-prolyl isomerase